MQNDCLYTITEAEQLVQGFISCNLPKEEWTHEAHLIGGIYILAHFGENAMDEMRSCLQRYNLSVGGVNDDHNGYHETMTYFWLWLLRKKFGGATGQALWSQDTLDELLTDESLAERNCWREYYSEEVMKSVTARRQFVVPDKLPFE